MKLKLSLFSLSMMLAVQNLSASKIEMGAGASATDGNIAIGDGSNAGINRAEHAIAIGKGANAGTSGFGRRFGAVSGIAIGQNSYAHADGIHIGSSKSRPDSRNAATIVGSQSMSDGLGSVVVGAHSKIDVIGSNDTRAAFSSSVGAFNTVTLKNTDSSNGAAITISGAANKVEDSNAVAIVGTGNIVKNAFQQADLSSLAFGAALGSISVDAAQKLEMGSVGVIGGGNTAENIQNSLIAGVQNEVTGSDRIELNNVVGYKNKVSDASHVILTGEKNNISASAPNTSQYITGFGQDNTVSDSYNVQLIGRGHNIRNSGVLGGGLTFNSGDNEFVSAFGLAHTVEAGKRITVFGQGNSLNQVNNATVGGAGHNISGASKLSVFGLTHTVDGGSESLSIFGENNTLSNVTNSTIGGVGNAVKNSSGVVLFGNAVHVDGNNDSVILGNKISITKDKTDVVALGKASKVEVDAGVALGSESVANRTALQSGAVATDAPAKLGSEVYAHESATAAQKKAIEATVKGNLGAVSVGNDGATRQIINVAPGSADSDAVNVAQLKSVSAAVTNVTHQHHEHVTYVNQYITYNEQRLVQLESTQREQGKRIQDNFDAINGVNIHVNKMDEELKAGIAGATAIAFLQNPERPGKSMISLGVGGFKNARALAIGFASNSDNDRISIKAGVSINSKKDLNWGGSIGYQW